MQLKNFKLIKILSLIEFGLLRTKLPDLPSLIADRRHSLFCYICRLPENTTALQALQLSIEAHTGTPPAADWKCPPGRS